jgi:hypothetical protein
MRPKACFYVLSCCLVAGTHVASAESQKPEGSKGITVEDLGRGLKSAAQIGPAIGNTVKKITGKDSDKPAQSQAKDKK